MNPYPHEARRPGHRGQTGRLLRTFVPAILLSVCLPGVQSASGQNGGVYVSGQGASLHDAFGQALAENERGAKLPFWVIISGNDILRVTKAAAERDILVPMQRVLDRRGFIYVCRSDMAYYGIQEFELLDGVKPVRGLGSRMAPEGLPLMQNGIVMPTDMTQAMRILKTCADRDGTEVRRTRWTRQSGAGEAAITRL